MTGCKSRHRRDVDEADDSSHLVSGGPYLLVADKGMYRYFINNLNCLIYFSSILRKFLFLSKCKYVSPGKNLLFNLTYNNLVVFFTGTNFNGIVRDGLFNFREGLWFFFQKNILIPNVAEKNILILVEEKKI